MFYTTNPRNPLIANKHRQRIYNLGNTIPLCDWYFPFLSL